jgi:uncharacterized protein (TIRG00374 family)
MKKIKILISLTLSGLFLWLALLKVNLKELTNALVSADYFLISIAAIVNALSFIPRAYRWKILLKPLKNTGFGNTFGSLSVGLMANSILPARGGELIRAFAIGRTERISKSASFATIMVERVFDLITLILFLLVFSRLIHNNTIVSKIFWITLIVTISVIIFLIILRNYRKATDILVSLSPAKFKEKIKKFLEAFIRGLHILSDLKILLYLFIQSVFIWSLYAAIYYILFISFGFRLPLGAAFVVTAICCLGISIPSSPGFIGTYHYLVIFSLSLFGIPKSSALSYSIIAWAVDFLPIVVIGLFALNKLSLTLTIKE